VEFLPYNLLCLLTGYNNNQRSSRYQGQGGQWYPLRELNGRTLGEHICTSINVMMLTTIQIAHLFTLLQHKFHSSLKFSIEKQQYIIIGLQQLRTIDRLFGDSGVSLLSLYSLQLFVFIIYVFTATITFYTLTTVTYPFLAANERTMCTGNN
jgi:hypothetical protein